MTTYATGNPLGSPAAKDLYDNAENLDTGVNTEDGTWVDRLGVSRKSWAGMESEFDADQAERADEYAADKAARDSEFDADQDQRESEFDDDQAERIQRFNDFLASSGYEFLGDYAAGIQFTEYNQLVRDTGGEFWRASGSTELPYTTDGMGLPESGALTPVGDAVLRQQLDGDIQDGNGARLVRGAVIYTDTLAEAQALTGLSDGQYLNIGGSIYRNTGGTLGRLREVYLDSYITDKDADNTTEINQARDDAEGGVLIVGEGIYLTSEGLRIKSNTVVKGQGIDKSIIKLTEDSPSTTHAITNDSNTGSNLTNTGNVNIGLFDITADGNGKRSVTGPSGCAIQFANVTGLRCKNIKGYRGRLHDIDIASSEYQSNMDQDWYQGASSDVVLENPVALHSGSDDAITTHFSHNIIIINPQSAMVEGEVATSSTQGLEIDDGSYDVKVFGGYCKGFTKGLQVKGHETAVPAHDVLVVGYTAEGCEYNYDVQHGGANGDDARNVRLIDCTSIAPAVVGGTYSPRHGEFRDYTSLSVVRLSCIGGDSLLYGLNIISGLRESIFDDISFRDVNVSSGGSSSLIRVPAGDPPRGGIKYRNIKAFDCTGGPVINSFDSTNGLDVDGVYAEQSGTPIQSVIRTSGGVQTNTNTKIRNVGFGSGYESVLSDEDGVDSIDLSAGSDFGKTNTKWVRANSNGGVAGSPQIINSIGWASGNQNLGTGESVVNAYYFKVKDAPPVLAGYHGITKSAGEDSDQRTDFMVATLSTGDSSPVERWLVRHNGPLSPAQDNVYSVGQSTLRPSEIYAATGAINTSDTREKQQQRKVSQSECDVAKLLMVKGQFFKWNEAVAKKGEDARWHYGWMAQEVQEAFASEGLDASRYGMFCYNEHEDGSDRYGLRIDQVNSFILGVLGPKLATLLDD